MKSMIMNLARLVLGAGMLLTLVNCNKSSDSGTANSSVVNTQNLCGAGYVNSQYGCIPQGNCPAGQGMYQNMCIQATVTNQTCQAGYLYSSQYNQCLQQGGCQAGFAIYNNQCVYVGYNVGNTNNTMSCQGSCPVGQVQTQNGCLPQGACKPCYGYSNNGWCYPSLNGGY